MKNRNNPKWYLPSKGKSKKAGEKTASDPTKHTKKSSQRAGFGVQTDVEHRVDDGQEEAKIQSQRKIASENGKRKVEDRRREIEDENSGEEYWPNEQHVNSDVDWVAVISSIESEVLF